MEEVVLRSWTKRGRPEAILVRGTERRIDGFKRYTFRYTRFFDSDIKTIKLVVSPDYKIQGTERNPMGRYWHTASKNELQFIKRVHFAEICSIVHFDKNLLNDRVESLN